MPAIPDYSITIIMPVFQICTGCFQIRYHVLSLCSSSEEFCFALVSFPLKNNFSAIKLLGHRTKVEENIKFSYLI